tara:strand:- start:7487 stop:7813 length:327 start_codon:yes stop_codon:yes gene_type:complete
MKIEAYITTGCTYCTHLRELIFRANLQDDTTYIKVGKHITREEFIEKFPNANGYPYVVIDGVEYAGLVPTARFFVEQNLVTSSSNMSEKQKLEISRRISHDRGSCHHD